MTEKPDKAGWMEGSFTVPGPCSVDMREEAALWLSPEDSKALLHSVAYHIAVAINECKRLVRSHHSAVARSAWGHLEEAGKEVCFDVVCSAFNEKEEKDDE